MKNLIGILCTLAVSVALFAGVCVPLTTGAQICGDFEYNLLTDGTVEILSCNKDVTELVIPATLDGYPVSTLSFTAFWNCPSAASISIPDSVTHIKTGAFSQTAYYNNEENWTDGVLYIDDCLIQTRDTLPEEYTIRQGTRMICDSAFYWRQSLRSVTVPDSVLIIDGSAFYSCTALEHVNFGNGVETIGQWAFYQCKALKEIKIGAAVKKIDNSAFKSCTSLADIALPDTAFLIGEYAFEDTAYYNNAANWQNDILYIGNHLIKATTDLKGDFIVKDGTKTLACGAFTECVSMTTITLPESVALVGGYPFSYCTALNAIEVDDQNMSYLDVDGVLFSKDKTVLVCYPAGKTASSYTVPGGVLKIGSGAVRACAAMESILLSDSVRSIGACAFADSYALKSVTMTDSVTSMEGTAFMNSENATIYGFADSYAQQFAGGNGITFKVIPVPVVGDVNYDKTVDAADATAVFAFLNGQSVPTMLSAADRAGDGKVDLSDAVWLFYVVSGVI